MKPIKKNAYLHWDRGLLVSILGLSLFGLLMVASASVVISDHQYGYPFHYFWRQAIYIILGIGLAYGVCRMPIKQWARLGPYLFIGSVLLLIVLLIPGVGHRVNGSLRWIRLGPVSIQVSELVKFTTVLYIAGYMIRHADQLRSNLMGLLKPMIVVGLLSLLLLIQPDFGAVAVINVTTLGLLFLAGARLWPFTVLLLGAAGVLGVIAVSAPYRLQRMTAFLHPWANQYDTGYQLTQSLIAFGRGGVFGVGLGNSVQKLFYLPEAHTDFLFAVIGEELGLMGELLTVGLFGILVYKALQLGLRAARNDQLFASYVAYGIGLLLAIQVMVNMGVNLGALPTKGLTLPLMSYGGSSILINFIMLGLLFRVAHESRRRGR